MQDNQSYFLASELIFQFEKHCRGEMKRSTISKEAGSTTFDFLAKKSEGEMFHVLSLIQSNELYIRDANAMVRSQRGRRTQANEEEYLEVQNHFPICIFKNANKINIVNFEPGLSPIYTHFGICN